VCLDTLFGRKEEVFNPAAMRILTSGRDTYGGGNNLYGCVNDSKYLPVPIQAAFPACDVRRYLNYKATARQYQDTALRAVKTLSVGATAIIIADSCFSEGITKANPHDMFCGRPVRNRYLPNPYIKPGLPRHARLFMPTELRWLVISACQEHQTAADAYFSDIKMNRGALSRGLDKKFEKGMTWQEWFTAASTYITYQGFSQIPTFDGPLEKKHEIIGSSETLIIHNSSHGSQVYDVSGDEADGYDEVLVFDNYVLDDNLNAILQNIPKN